MYFLIWIACNCLVLCWNHELSGCGARNFSRSLQYKELPLRKPSRAVTCCHVLSRAVSIDAIRFVDVATQFMQLSLVKYFYLLISITGFTSFA